MDLARRVTDTYNATLRFDPSLPRMAYTVRDPVLNRTLALTRPHPHPHPRSRTVHSNSCSFALLSSLLLLSGYSVVVHAQHIHNHTRALRTALSSD